MVRCTYPRPHHVHRIATAFLAAVLLALAATRAVAQTASPVARAEWNPEQVLRSEKYVRPPANVERIITAPRTDISFTSPSPDRRWFLRMVGPARGDLQYYGKSHINLAGLQIDTLANRARTLTLQDDHAFLLIDPRSGATRTIDAPNGATISSPVWSPSG